MAKNKKNTSKPTNTQDVVIHAIDTFYNLINSGNFVGVILLCTVLLSFLVVWKLPADGLSGHIGSILNIFKSDKYYLFVLVPCLAGSLIGNFIQRKVYKAEIKRLVAQRKFLIHGRKKDILKALDNHHPSKFDLDEEE